MARHLLASMAVVLLNAAALAGEPAVTFAKKPSATRAGGKVNISFAVSAQTDVEVALLDARGKVVRRLAAGLLGKNAPEPFRKNSLAQELTWDGKNDDGEPVRAAKVRVRLGLTAKLERMIGWSGQSIDRPKGLACGPDGTLYVMHGERQLGHRQTTLVTAHDRNGKYLRQVFPGPANLPPGKRKGWPRMRLSENEEVPVVFHQLTRCTYPGAVFSPRNFPVVTGDGRLITLSARSSGTVKHPDIRGGRRLLILGVDGSVPGNFLGPELPGSEKLYGFAHLALSPDGKHVYVAGFFEKEKRGGRGLCHAVWRLALDGAGKGGVFIGTLYRPGKGAAGLNDPQGLAVDKAGRVYVADYGNDRIAVFAPDGKYLDEIPVKHPDQVRVSRKTGAIYVMCLEERKKPITDGHWFNPAHNWKMKRVVKFGGLTDKTEKASLSRPRAGKRGGGALLALDDSGREPLLWVCDPNPGRKALVKIADRGGKLELLGDPISESVGKGTIPSFATSVMTMGEKLLVRYTTHSGGYYGKLLVYDAETGAPAGTYIAKTASGKWQSCVLYWGDSAGGPDGHLYSHVVHKLWRHDAAGKPVPFATPGDHAVAGMYHGHQTYGGIFVARNGSAYIPVAPANRKIEEIKLKVIGPDGKVRNPCAVHIQGAKIGGIAVDSKGNIYVGAKVALKAERIPPLFAGKLPEDSAGHHPGNAYKQYGSILKFPPAGGEVLKDPGGKYTADCYRSHSVSTKNVLWLRRGGYLPNHGHEAGCCCESTRFDIDGYDRLFVPDPFRFSVAVMDSAGNEITRFGSYGNMDSRGPGSPAPRPEIAFGWPIVAAEHRGRVFVADLVNRRVVAVRLEHAAEAECGVTR